MQRYAVEIKKYREFCELCNEYHDHFDCPACGKDFYGLTLKDRIATCPHCSTDYMCWGKDKESQHIILVECLEMSFTRLWRVWCFCNEVDYSGNDHDMCSEEGCPLLKEEDARVAASLLA